MRIHPLTRVVRDGPEGRAIIEARIELFDHLDHTTKGCGELRIELVDASSGGSSRMTTTWRLDLRDPEVNLERYDDVTRTYLVPLEIDLEHPLPALPELRATFDSADGRSFRARPLRLRTE
jgi:hypothetical protein